MFEHWLKTDLQRLPEVKTLQGRYFSEDDEANLVGVIVTDGGEAVTLTGDVSASVICGDGSTVTVNGSKSGNTAWVVLPDEVYIPGKIGVYLKLTNETQVTTLGALEAYVYKSA